MKIISDREWLEYKNLKSQNRFDSVRELENLEDDIDLPIREIVAMLALLGCNPIFSCCGFDYDGQPVHKSHEYGCIYFILSDNDNTKILIDTLKSESLAFPLSESSKDEWTYWKEKNSVFLRSAFTIKHKDIKYPWTLSKDCIHYSEVAHFRIKTLRNVLLKLSDKFMDSVILFDTNEKYKNIFRSWQYPSLKPWIIFKESIV